jgi:excisionase family DNA binding protein
MEDALTIREVAIVTGLHRNTIRNYVKAGTLKATLVDKGLGRQRYLIGREDLYTCGIPKVLSHLGPLEVQERLSQAQAKDTDDTFAEIMRLNRELLAAREELAGLRVRVPALQAAQVERDQIAQEKAALEVRAEVLEAALEQAQANAKWSWRRRMAKAAK